VSKEVSNKFSYRIGTQPTHQETPQNQVTSLVMFSSQMLQTRSRSWQERKCSCYKNTTPDWQRDGSSWVSMTGLAVDNLITFKCIILLLHATYMFVKLRAQLTLYLLTWRIWWAPNNVSKGQMGFNLAFKGL